MTNYILISYSYCVLMRIISEQKSGFYLACVQSMSFSWKMINNLVMAVLLESGLPKSYWGEAVFYVIHILNAISPRKLDPSPFEAIFRRKPKIEMLHPFGCEAWVHVPKVHRKKFDVKA